MRINIITIHAMHNPGSALQAYALQNYLTSSKNEVAIINYCPDYFYKENKGIKYLLKKSLYYKNYKSRSKKFDDFISKNMKLTPRYRTYKHLDEANIEGDVFIAGSDQLWNTDYKCGKDDAFYLKFVKNGKKISYSTSVGKKDIDIENARIIENNLSDFKCLSVREKSTSNYLSELLHRDVNFVCDPVFLLEKEKYKEFINPINVEEVPYVMIYLTPQSEVLDSIVQLYRNKGFRIVLVGGFSKRCYCDKHIKDAGPEDFLTYIYYADVLISTSFHATAFAHIFHKNFFSIAPKRNGERIKSLLQVSGLEGKMIDENFKIDSISDDINWSEVDKKIEDYKNESKKYLKCSIESHEDEL